MPDEKDMDYVLIANYAVWKSLAFGELDPVQAIMNRKMRVTGDLSAMMRVAPGFSLDLSIVQSRGTGDGRA